MGGTAAHTWLNHRSHDNRVRTKLWSKVIHHYRCVRLCFIRLGRLVNYINKVGRAKSPVEIDSEIV